MSYKNRRQSNNYSVSKFTEKRTPKFIMNDDEFPELIISQTTQPDTKEVFDFKSVLLTEQPVINDIGRKLKKGWSELSLENGNIIRKYNGDEYIESFNLSAFNTINNMAHVWNIYKNDYDELFGEGAYEEVYKVEEYMEWIEEEDCSSDEE